MLERREERRARIKAVRWNRKMLKIVGASFAALLLIISLLEWLGFFSQRG
jgi:hypothetical protein